MKPEEKARQRIDKLLGAAGWSVQSMSRLNLSASLGVAVREFPVESGFADYVLVKHPSGCFVLSARWLQHRATVGAATTIRRECAWNH
jgi:type I restriction enzyme R subunit